MDIMDTVIMLFLGAGKKKGPFRQRVSMSMCFIYFQEGFHSFQQVCSHNLSARFTSTLGTGADRPDDQGGVHLLMVHSPVQTVQGYKR